MKKIIKSFLLILTVISSLISTVSCSDEVKYSKGGLTFTLPKDMKEMNVNYADVCFGNDDGAEFFIYYYSRDALLTELYLDKDVSVSEYADWFVDRNEYENVDKKLNSAGNIIVMSYIYEPEEDYYVDYITRNKEALFHVTMSCAASQIEKYQPIFEEWMADIYIDM